MNKPEHLDRDRTIDLDANVAQTFAQDLTNVFLSAPLRGYLSEAQLEKISSIITNQADFPFLATVEDNEIDIKFTPQEGLKLKALSDGITNMYKSIIRTFRDENLMPPREQSFIATISQAFQSSLQRAYTTSGMPEGPHTKYECRGC